MRRELKACTRVSAFRSSPLPLESHEERIESTELVEQRRELEEMESHEERIERSMSLVFGGNVAINESHEERIERAHLLQLRAQTQVKNLMRRELKARLP